MATRIVLYRDLAHRLNDPRHYPVTGTATGGTTTTLIDTVALGYSSGDANSFDRKWVYNETGTDEARVTEEGLTAGSSQLTISPAITTFGTATPRYVITDESPAELRDALDQIHTNMYEETLWPLSLHVTKNDSNNMEPSSIATDFALATGGAAAATESTRVYHGAQSLQLTASAINEYAALTTQMPVTEGEQLVAAIMSSVTQGDDFIFRVIDVTNSSATIDSATNDEVRWTELIVPIGVPNNCEEIDLRMILVGSNDVAYVDNIQVWSQGWAVYPLPSFITRPEQVVDVRYWPQGTASEGTNAFIPDETGSRPLNWRFESADRRAGTGTRLSPLFLGVQSPGFNRPFVVAKRDLGTLSSDTSSSPADQDEVVRWAVKYIEAEADEKATVLSRLRAQYFMRPVRRSQPRVAVRG